MHARVYCTALDTVDTPLMWQQKLLFGSSTRNRHAFGQSTHGDLASAASIRVVTGGSRLGFFSRLLDELVQLC